MWAMFTAAWWREAIPLAKQPEIRNRAIKVALIVGTILTIINQFDVMWRGEFPNLLKMALTYCVPYLVNTHGAVTARMGK